MGVDYRNLCRREFENKKGPLFDVVSRIHATIGSDESKFVSSGVIDGSSFGISILDMEEPLIKEKDILTLMYMDRGELRRTWINKLFVWRNIDKVNLFNVAIVKGPDWFDIESGIVFEPVILEPGQICTDSFLVVGSFSERGEAESFKKYLYTKFVKFLLFCSIERLFVYSKTFEHVPLLDFYRDYSDADLYEMFGIYPEVKYVIESLM